MPRPSVPPPPSPFAVKGFLARTNVLIERENSYPVVPEHASYPGYAEILEFLMGPTETLPSPTMTLKGKHSISNRDIAEHFPILYSVLNEHRASITEHRPSSPLPRYHTNRASRKVQQ